MPDGSGSVAGRVKSALQGIEGIEKIVEPTDYGSYGLPQPDVSDQMGAFFLVARDGYAFTADTAGPTAIRATKSTSWPKRISG